MSKVLEPRNGYIVIQPSEEGETMAGNIILPDLGKEKPAQGVVIAVSRSFNTFTGSWSYADGVDVGDTVLIPRVGSLRVTVDDKEYYMCKFSEVLAILK